MNHYRIATTLEKLTSGYFIAKKLFEPDEVLYYDFSEETENNLGGMSRNGASYVIITWRNLPARQARIIRRLVEEAEVISGNGFGKLYMTILRTDATSTVPGWIDISGIAVMPKWQPDTSERAKGSAFSSVVLILKNTKIEALPSTAI